MSLARDMLLNLFIQAVVTFLERRGKKTGSRDLNVGTNQCRFLKASVLGFFKLNPDILIAGRGM